MDFIRITDEFIGLIAVTMLDKLITQFKFYELLKIHDYLKKS